VSTFTKAGNRMLAIAGAGVSVIRIDPRTKKPFEAWKQYQSAIAPESLREKWAIDLKAYAAVMGHVSGGLFAIDFDVEGFYDVWRKATGELSDGLCFQITQGLGWQVWGRTDNPGGNQKLAWVKDDSTAAGRSIAIETRGEGGYAVGPDSIGPSGNVYTAIEGDWSNIPYIPQDRFDALLEAAMQLCQCPTSRQEDEALKAAKTAPVRSSSYRTSLNSEVGVIDVFNQTHTIHEVLLRNGYQRDGRRMIRPGADEDSQAGVVFFERNGKKVSYHWSSNDPLNDHHAHDSFSAYCCLECKNDLTLAVRRAAQIVGMGHKKAANTAPTKPQKTEAVADETQASEAESVVLPVSAVSAGIAESTARRRPKPYRPFPTKLLPYTARLFITEAAQAIGCDESFIALPLLVGFATCIGTSRRIRITFDWCEFPVLWAVIVASSGQRKSPAMSAATESLQKMQAKWFDEHREAMAEYKASLREYKAALKQAEKSGADVPDEPTKPVVRRGVISECTVESVVPILQENPRGVGCFRDEVSGWVGSFNVYKGGRGSDASQWLEMHRGGVLVVDRKTGDNRTIYVPRAAVNIAGTIQPGVVKRAFGTEFFESGLVARILWAMPDPKQRVWTDGAIQPHTSDRIASIYRFLADLKHDEHDAPIDIPLTGEAQSIFKTFVNEWGAEQAKLGDERLEAAWSKLEGYAARLALVHHLVRVATNDATLAGAGAVDAESINAGIKLARWFSYEAERVYGNMAVSDEDHHRQKLVDLIRGHGGEITSRELTRNCRKYPDTASAEAALNELVGLKIGTWKHEKTNTTGGRPIKRFVIAADTADSDETHDSNSPQGVSSAADAENQGCVGARESGVLA